MNTLMRHSVISAGETARRKQTGEEESYEKPARESCCIIFLVSMGYVCIASRWQRAERNAFCFVHFQPHIVLPRVSGMGKDCCIMVVAFNLVL